MRRESCLFIRPSVFTPGHGALQLGLLRSAPLRAHAGASLKKQQHPSDQTPLDGNALFIEIFTLHKKKKKKKREKSTPHHQH